MEPIEEWMEETLHHAGLTKTQRRGKLSRHDPNWNGTYKAPLHANIEPTHEDPTWPSSGWPTVFDTPHPEEDCFEVPLHLRDELTGAPEVPPKLNPEEQLVLNTFMNVASAAERLGDSVVLPEHYARFPIEPIRFCIENNLNGFQFNIVKYIMRWDAKNGMEDLKKARRYLEMFIKFVGKDPDWWRP